MLIALDNDGTFTAMPEVWTKFIELARAAGAEVVCISSRFPQVPINGFPGKVYYTCGQQKWEWADEHGMKVDIWIDDMPCCIGGPPGLEPGQAKQRREIVKQIFAQNGDGLMASLDDVVSNLKNVVTNLSGLVTGTSLVNSISTLTLSVNSIASTLATALATNHLFGGSTAMASAVTSVVISDAKLASTGVISFSPGNSGAASTIFEGGVYVGPITAGSFSLVVNLGSAVSSGVFYYVGYNP